MEKKKGQRMLPSMSEWKRPYARDWRQTHDKDRHMHMHMSLHIIIMLFNACLAMSAASFRMNWT